MTQFDLVSLIRHHSHLARMCKLSALACQEAAWDEPNDNIADVSRSLAKEGWRNYWTRRGMVRAFSMVLRSGRETALDRAKRLMPNWP